MSLQFLLISLVLVATPGAGVLFTVSKSLASGRVAGLMAALGCTFGIVPHLALAVAALAGLLQAPVPHIHLIRLAGSGYLLWLAYGLVTSRPDPVGTNPETSAEAAWSIIVKAVLINLLNPKLTLFFFAFLPQFVKPGQGALIDSLELAGVFSLMTLVVFAIYALIAASLSGHVKSNPRRLVWFNRVMGVVLALLAGDLALRPGSP